MEAQRHISLQVFLQHLFFFSSVALTCSGRFFHCGSHCIPMSYENSLESVCSSVQLIRTVHSAVLDICFLAYSYIHAVMLAINHCMSRLLAHIFFTFIGMIMFLQTVSKRSQFFRQSSSSSCSLFRISCRFFFFT